MLACPTPKGKGERDRHVFQPRWWQLKYFWKFHPYLGKIPILTNIFQMGWNHQPATVSGQISLRPNARPILGPPKGSVERKGNGTPVFQGNRVVGEILWTIWPDCIHFQVRKAVSFKVIIAFCSLRDGWVVNPAAIRLEDDLVVSFLFAMALVIWGSRRKNHHADQQWKNHQQIII